MLSKKTVRRIKEHKWNEHSNKSLFFKRIQEKADQAIKGLTLLAKELDEEQLQEIFTDEKLKPLIEALMRPDLSRPKRKIDQNRIFFLGHLFLTWSLNITGSTLDNFWAQKMYHEHEGKLREILEILHHERKRSLNVHNTKT